MLEQLIVAAIVGGLTALISATLFNINNKKRNSGKYLNKKLKPYYQRVKEICSTTGLSESIMDIQTYTLNYLYECKSGNKKYYSKTYGLQTTAIEDIKMQNYLNDLYTNSDKKDIVNCWAMFMIYARLKHISPNSNILDFINKIEKETNKIIDSKIYPISFKVILNN